MSKIKVHAWSADSAGCGAYRCRWVADALNKHYGDHIEATEGTTMGERLREEVDVVVGQRVCLPGSIFFWEKWRNEGEKLLVLEVDDDLFSVPESNIRGSAIFNSKGHRERLLRAFKAAHYVTVSTEPLKEAVHRNTGFPLDRIFVIPNALPPELLLTPEELEQRTPVNTLGYLASPTHHADFKMVQRHVRRFLENNPGTMFHTIGSPYGDWLKLPSQVTHTSWVESPSDAILKIDYGIGICPLTGGVFNQSKCLDSETRIATDRGVLRISDIVEGDQVWHDGHWRKVEATHHEVPKPGLKVTLADGYSLKMSSDHRMLVNGEFLQASQFRIGDKMHLEPETFGTTEYVSVPFPSESRMSRKEDVDFNDFVNCEDVPRLTITPRWGRFLGAFVGDGSLGGAGYVKIHCDGQDSDWVDLLMEDLRQMGFHPSLDGGETRRQTIRVASVQLVRTLDQMGLVEWKKGNNKRGQMISKRVCLVPEAIWNSPRDVVAEFLSGYFEADGCVTASGVNLVGKSQDLVNDVQRLLTLFGIQSVTKTREYGCQNGFKGDYRSLSIRRIPAATFRDEIHFKSQRKRDKLDEIVSRRLWNSAKRVVWEQEIVSIEPCFLTPVDLQVEGSVFSAAGMVSHNSDCKAIENMARGAVTIASDTAPYAPVIHGETGYKVRREHEWGRVLQRVYDDPEDALRIRRNGLEYVRNHRTTDVTAPLWRDVLLRDIP